MPGLQVVGYPSLVVFGEGKLQPLAMVVGEGPGADEDASGRPFVGRAGQYLDRWLASIGLSRQSNAYIANIVKCRPPGNRDPEADEVEACLPYLKRQVELIQPRSILCLGRTAAHTLLSSTDSIQQMRSRWYRFDSIPVLVTYHPSAVLRNPNLRAAVWEDLKRLAAFLKIEIPAKAVVDVRSVLLDTPVKHVFTYRIPDSMHAVTGMRCQVPFGRREVTAFIVETVDRLPDTSYEIKEIKRMIDKEPLFGKAEVELAQWMGRFYVCSPGEALAAMVPSGRRDIGLPPFECGEFGLEIEPEQLSEPQRRAIDSILSSSSSLHYLYGVTGSGKSEVFHPSRQTMIERNLQVIYLVPRSPHAQLAYLVGRFKNRWLSSIQG